MKVQEVPIGSLVTKCSTWDPRNGGAGEFRYVDISSVDKEQKNITRAELVECSNAPSRARQLIQENDVLVATVRPNLNGVALVGEEHDGATASTGYCVLRPLPGKLDSRFLFHWVRTSIFIQRMVDVASGANYPAVSDAKVKQSSIPLFALAEQNRIAKILDAVDALRARRRESLDQLDALLQSTFLEMFGDPVTNSKGWETKILKGLGWITTGKTPPTKRPGMFGGDIPFATPGDLDIDLESTSRTLTREGANYSKVVRPGSALVGCIGNIGKISIARVPTAFNQQINAVEWGDAVNDWFGVIVLGYAKHQMISKASSTTLPILNKTGFSSISIIVPPLKLQKEFATIVESIEHQKARLRTHLAELDALFASLQARAFAGEL